jgi:CHRD domain
MVPAALRLRRSIAATPALGRQCGGTAALRKAITQGEGTMQAITGILKRALWLGVPTAALLLAGCESMPSMPSFMGGSAGVHVDLSGSQEVPPVDVPGTGSGTITVASSGAVSGSVTTAGVAGVAAHIHMGAIGTNGPVIVPLTKTAANTWSVPEGKKLNDAQMKAYKAGDLYVNVHTAAHKGGEVRGQIIP